MKLLIDFLPLVLFFIAYKVAGIYVATAVLMAAITLQMLYVYKTEGRLQIMHKLTLVLVWVFGVLTLILQDERFIKLKPTILYAAMGLALMVTERYFKRNPLEALLGQQLALPASVWRRLTWAWVLYCFFMSALNAYVAYTFSTEAWVDFKLWGYVFPVTFLIGQGIYIARHLPKS